METDSWKGSETFYVGVHRKEIEEVARALSSMLRPIRARFVPQHKCAELHFECGLAFAHVNMHGEFGSAYEVVVTTVSALNDAMQAAIRKAFPENLRIIYHAKIS